MGVFEGDSGVEVSAQFLAISIVIVMIAISFLKDIGTAVKKYESWVNYGENKAGS